MTGRRARQLQWLRPSPRSRQRAGTVSPWRGFRTGLWQKEINVRDFIQQNYEPYDGDASFLTPATARTQWKALGMEYKLETTEPPTLDRVERVCALFRREGLTTH